MSAAAQQGTILDVLKKKMRQSREEMEKYKEESEENFRQWNLEKKRREDVSFEVKKQKWPRKAFSSGLVFRIIPASERFPRSTRLARLLYVIHSESPAVFCCGTITSFLALLPSADC
jgi:hypothetical protein